MVKFVPAHRRLPLVGPLIDRIEVSRLAFRRYRPEDVPYAFSGNVLEISTNIGCKVNCYYCPQQLIIERYLATGDRPPMKMSLDTFDNCIRTVPNETSITFSGFSEPFHNPDASTMILRANVKGHEVTVYTTLVGLDLGAYQEIRAIPFKEFVVHLPDMEQTSNIPITAEYLELLETIASDPPSGLRFCILGRNLDPRVSKIISTRGFSVVIIQVTDRVGNLAIEDMGVSRPHFKNGRIESLCRHRVNVLLPDGRVYLCFNDFGLKNKLGNLLDDDYRDLFSSPDFISIENSLTDANIDSNCRHCIFSVRVK